MHRFKNIVVSTDMSSGSLGVISYAGHLARDEGSRLTVVHVAPSVSLADYADLIPGRDLDIIDRDLLEHARTSLEKWVQRHLKKLDHVEVVVEQGRIEDVVCKVVEEVGGDVLVVGSHGRDGLSHLVLGSVAEKIMRRASCPVLVVKPPQPAVLAQADADEGSKDAENGVSA